MKYLLILVLTVHLYSRDLINLQTPDVLGKVSFNTETIVIASGNALELFIPMSPMGRQICKHTEKVVLCQTKECVIANIDKYKRLYRTNGISMITWKSKWLD